MLEILVIRFLHKLMRKKLYSADDNYTSVIAQFQRSRRVLARPSEALSDPNASSPSLSPTLVNPVWTPAVLTLTPRAREVQDLVVTSFLFLEKTHRINEREHQNRADVLGTPLKPIGRSAVVDGGV